MTTTPDPFTPPTEETIAPVPVVLGRIELGVVLIVVGLGIVGGLAWLIATAWEHDGLLLVLAEIAAEWGIWVGGAGLILAFVGVLLIVRARRKDTGITFGSVIN